MKRMIKRMLKPAWRMTEPVRRPISLRVEAYLRRCFSVSVTPEPNSVVLEHLNRELGRLQDPGVVLDHLVRELVRLQDQVEHLRLVIEEQTHTNQEHIALMHRKAG